MAELTTDVARQLLNEQSRALVAEMMATNKPIERELERINQHLAKLNGQVAKHAEALSDSRSFMASVRKDVDQLEKRHREDGEERRQMIRRDDDVEARVALLVKDKIASSETGENKRITMRDLYITVGVCGVFWTVLKALGIIP